MAIESVKNRVSSMLSDSATKLDFLKGRKRCRHDHHEKNVDRSCLQKKIFIESLVDKLVKAQTEISFANRELLSANRHGKKARDVKLRLLAKLEMIDLECYQKLANELHIKIFSWSECDVDARYEQGLCDPILVRERAIDAEWDVECRGIDAALTPPANRHQSDFIRDINASERLRDDRIENTSTVRARTSSNNPRPSNGIGKAALNVVVVGKAALNGGVRKTPPKDSDEDSDDDSSSDDDEEGTSCAMTKSFFSQYLSY